MKNISQYLAIGLSALVVVILVYTFSNVVMYVLIAWVLSTMGQPLMEFFQKRVKLGKYKIGPNLAAGLTLITYIVVVTLLVMLFVPLVIQQASNLARVDYQAVATALEEPLNQLNEWLAENGMSDPEQKTDQGLQQFFSKNFDPSIITNTFSSVLAAASGILFGAFAVIFITFFFLKEKGLFKSFFLNLLPSRYDNQITEVFDDSSYLLSRYFRSILIQISIITTYMWVLLTFFGVKNAFLISVFAAIINVIPYLGPLLGAIFGVFITISSNLDLDFYNEMAPLLIKVLIIFATMQMLDNFLLQPFIFSNSVLAHPLEIFLIILMGAQLYGILGMVLAIPTYTVIRVIAKEFLHKFKIVKKVTGKMKEVVD